MSVDESAEVVAGFLAHQAKENNDEGLYDLWYRFGTPPWVGHARSTLVEMVQSGDLLPGRAIDLGCGEGDIAIFLAEHGFQVTAVDFAPSAIAKAKAKASDRC